VAGYTEPRASAVKGLAFAPRIHDLQVLHPPHVPG
jgi:hypothetical protein